ncbi:hypothetical protein A3A63_02220 [Candidatus Gottesmanbacteria bacterium RIFCSPLOWO2_01_FULL_46_9]|uniref:Single cache domain-containing protein n=1 Tax=Candidatus Gottesmanbacteria bacterium RIFCSPLOWO2_01_FULL_46_9 TaxID=1798394 RepID=A0A1F6B4A0_9BACT|nr:MAG: hypothetical protein A3A63_02220 [Candidatus Gottesmanbacteria bacterium RIFCSPLOWO2_01_FULL_46_9]
MWSQFLLENAHFAIHLFTALVLFAVFWLYYDAWTQHKGIKEGVRIAGFLLLSFSYVIQATSVEGSILDASLLGATTNGMLVAITRITGYVIFLFILAVDPLEPRPDHKKKALTPALFMLPAASLSIAAYPQVLYPVLASITGFLYLRRATVGLEDHLKPLALSFFLLSISEFVGLSSLFRQTDNIAIYEFAASFGPLWILQQVVLVVAAFGFGWWVFGYLLKQFEVQLFMILTTAVLGIFLVTTVTFTGLLLKNIQDENLRELETNVKVLNFAIDSKKAELLSDAQVVAQNPQVVQGVVEKARKPLADLSEDILLAKKASSLVIAGEGGQVLARGEDRDRAGDSLSDDPLVKRALLGESTASVVTRDGILAPEVSVRAATAIKDNGTIIGVVVTGALIDSAFVDGLKKATGLETAIYGDNQISTSTLISPDGKSRLVGLREEHARVKSAVLAKGESYTGSVNLLQRPYFAAYLPLKDVDSNPVGMLFVGKPQIRVLQTAGRSIELTFLVTVFLLVFSIVPAYFTSKYIAGQL